MDKQKVIKMSSEEKGISGEEFVKKILQGERDFSWVNINYGEGFDLRSHDSFEELQKYLRQQNLEESPIILNNAGFMRINAEGLYLPFIKADDVNFQDSNLAFTFLYNSQFKRSSFDYTNFRSAVLHNSNFEDSYLVDTILRDSDLRKVVLASAFIMGADFRGADVKDVEWTAAYCQESDIRGIKNLEYNEALDSVNFIETVVTSKEKKIIEDILKDRFILKSVDDDPFDVLGISKKSTYEEARKIYIKKVKGIHPDKFNGSKLKSEEFKDLLATWEKVKVHYSRVGCVVP